MAALHRVPLDPNTEAGHEESTMAVDTPVVADDGACDGHACEIDGIASVVTELITGPKTTADGDVSHRTSAVTAGVESGVGAVEVIVPDHDVVDVTASYRKLHRRPVPATPNPVVAEHQTVTISPHGVHGKTVVAVASPTTQVHVVVDDVPGVGVEDVNTVKLVVPTL